MASYDRRGSGSPVVLVHGLGSQRRVFDPVVDALAAHHDVISVDLPGFGATRADPRVTPGPAGYADWLADLFETLDVARPHVVGSSLGGGVAIELGRLGAAGRVTAFSPIGFWGRAGRIWTQGLLTGLRLVCTHATPVVERLCAHEVTRAAVLAPLFGRPRNVSRLQALEHVRGLVDCPSFPEARDSFASYDLHPRTDLGKLPDIPVTIAWGTRDVTLVHRTQSSRARAVLPFARHLALPGCGHLPFSDDPTSCARVILEDQ